jgi:transposase
MCYRGTCNTDLFNTWLKEMLVPELRPGQVIVLDNATFHKSSERKRIVEAAGCRLLFLPPYSPDLNPIEKCWANVKVKLREMIPRFKNFSDAFDSAILSFSF